MSTKKRAGDGKFKKGVSGNPNGRPSKKKQAAKIVEQMSEKYNEEGFDPKDGYLTQEKMLAFFNAKFDAAKTLDEQEKWANEAIAVAKSLTAYQKPRYQNIESDENKVTEMTISWGDPEDIPEDHPMYKLKNNPEK